MNIIETVKWFLEEEPEPPLGSYIVYRGAYQLWYAQNERETLVMIPRGDDGDGNVVRPFWKRLSEPTVIDMDGKARPMTMSEKIRLSTGI